MPESITNAEFQSFRDFFKGACGLSFADDKYPRVARAISNRMSALDAHSFADYFRVLTDSDKVGDELSILATLLTVGETYFFRNAEHWRAFEEVVLPGLLDTHSASGSDRIRIWSAGCSSGEEALTAAMVVRRLLGEKIDCRIEIIGTDINPKAVLAAQNAAYTRNSFRGVPDAIIQRFFTSDGASIYRPNPAIRELVEFREMNLLDKTATDAMQGCDVIFCRNVLIYFDAAGIDQAMTCFRGKLKTGGYLFLGHAEFNMGLSADFTSVNACNTIIFQVPPALPESTTEAARVSPTATQRPLPLKSTVEPESAQQMEDAAAATADASSLADLRRQAIEHMCLQQHREARELFDEILRSSPHDLDSLLGQALIAAGSGCHDAALNHCQQALTVQPLSADAYCVRALLHESLGESALARSSLEQAIYLDGQFSIAHFRLGNLHHSAGNHAAAARSFNNALLALPDDAEQRVRLYSGGFSKEALVRACRQYAGSERGGQAPGVRGPELTTQKRAGSRR